MARLLWPRLDCPRLGHSAAVARWCSPSPVSCLCQPLRGEHVKAVRSRVWRSRRRPSVLSQQNLAYRPPQALAGAKFLSTELHAALTVHTVSNSISLFLARWRPRARAALRVSLAVALDERLRPPPLPRPANPEAKLRPCTSP